MTFVDHAHALRQRFIAPQRFTVGELCATLFWLFLFAASFL